MRGCGRIVRPAFPAPSDLSGAGRSRQTSRENTRRDREAMPAAHFQYLVNPKLIGKQRIYQ
jgi:hypothetical protein